MRQTVASGAFDSYARCGVHRFGSGVDPFCPGCVPTTLTLMPSYPAAWPISTPTTRVSTNGRTWPRRWCVLAIHLDCALGSYEADSYAMGGQVLDLVIPIEDDWKQ